jgi:hypothetical protein
VSVNTLGFRTGAGGAGGNVGFGDAVLEYFLASRSRAPRSAAEWRRIERAKIGDKSGDHPRTQRVGDIEHDVVGSPMFDEGFQLIFQILGLLAGEARDRKVAMEALRRAPVVQVAVGGSDPRAKRTSVPEDLSVNWIKTYMF